MPVLVWNFAFFLIRLNENPSITNKMRVSFGQNELHSLWINKGHKPKHTLLLVWNPHVLNWPINASFNNNNIMRNYTKFRKQWNNKKKNELKVKSEKT